MKTTNHHLKSNTHYLTKIIMIHTLQEDNLQEVINSKNVVIALYGASWCGNCRILKPRLEMESDKNTDAHYVYVNAEKFENSRQLATVMNLPVTALFIDGKLVAQTTERKVENINKIFDEATSQIQ